MHESELSTRHCKPCEGGVPVFYLQSRGLDVETAKILLINAFAVEIIDRIPVASIRTKLAVAVKAFKAS